MNATIPNVEKLTPKERGEVVRRLRQRATEHEERAEADQEMIATLQADQAAHSDKAYHLRRMAHAIEQMAEGEPKPF